MFKFLTNKPFWVNLLAAGLLGFLIIFILLQLLGWITRHGEYLTVPAVTGKNTQEAIKLLESKGFEVVIQDSVFTDTASRGAVLKQLPDASSTVKINRMVFITVNRYIPPMITMPSLEGKPLNFALDLLERSHLQLGDTIFKPDYMKGAVIEQLFNNNRIAAGAKVQWGSRITLVVSSGLGESTLMVPDLTGLTYADAKAQVDSLGLILNPVPDMEVRDTLNAFIYRQNPSRLDDDKKIRYVRSGMMMDVWLSPVMKQIDSTNTNE
jgi:eukaryotic-like serine/threonine-protein kinase